MSGESKLLEEANDLKAKIKEVQDKANITSLKDHACNLPPIEKFSLKMRKQLRGHFSKVMSLEWHKDSVNLVSASQDGHLVVWDALTGLKTSLIPLRCTWVMACSYSEDGNFVAAGGLDNTVSIFNVYAGSTAQAFLKELFGHIEYVSCCKFAGNNKILTGSGDKKCILWDIETSKAINTFEGHKLGIMSIAYQPGSDYNVFATGACDNSSKMWDVREGKHFQTFSGHKKDVNSVAFFPNGQALATGSEDGTVRFYDLRSTNKLMTYNSNENASGHEFLTSIDFSLSGRLLFCGKWDSCIQVFDTLKGDQVASISHAHEHVVQCLSVSPNGLALATGSWDSLVKIWV